MGVFHVFKIVQMVPNRAKHLILFYCFCWNEQESALELQINLRLQTILWLVVPKTPFSRKAASPVFLTKVTSAHQKPQNITISPFLNNFL